MRRYELSGRVVRIRNDVLRCALWTPVFIVDSLIPWLWAATRHGRLFCRSTWRLAGRMYMVGIDGRFVKR